MTLLILYFIGGFFYSLYVGYIFRDEDDLTHIIIMLTVLIIWLPMAILDLFFLFSSLLQILITHFRTGGK